MSAPTKADALREQGAQAANETEQHPHDTKIGRVLSILRTRSMNRFEAERLAFDHCLNSTIAVLRRDGFVIFGEWEKVPTRAGKPARVLRYHFVRGPGVTR